MQRARRTAFASAAVAKAADANTLSRWLYWFLSFLVLSAVLMAAEIRSEVMTISALAPTETGAIKVEPQFVSPTRVTTIASAIVPHASDKD